MSIELIKELSDAFGPSGFEDEVCEIVKRELKDFKNLEEDTLRNIRCELKQNSGKYTVMLDSHLDEVGLMVQAIKPNGTMNFVTLGGWSKISLPGSKFNIKNTDGKLIESIVAIKPPHFMSAKEKEADISISDMVLDCGALDDKELKDYYKLKIASPGVPASKCKYDEVKQRFLVKAFDCRIGVATQIEIMKRLKDKELNIDVVSAFSSQEELGARGIQNNVEKINPKLAICFEGAPSDDTFMESYMVQAALNKGPMLRHIDATMITNPRFLKYTIDLANKLNIPIQEGVRSGGGTDAKFIHIKDIPTIVIGIPVRYIHSSYGFVTLHDYKAAVDLAIALCENLTEEIIDTF
ncbi:MAG TPA: peptidase M42 [Erysipelotrichaceae bacterium]|nr:peptidase M42 [Erysipelotrichaceae bacterium]